jgi:uncharacterized membrane protein YphA (DoxX/SURF4 family)
LLLLRAAVGVVVLFQGGIDLVERPDLTIGAWVAGALAIATGISLLAGFLTPIAAVLVGIRGTVVWISIVPALNANPTTSKLLVALAVAIVLLGPGAFSLDARLFGLREIIIPPSRTNA